MNLDAREEARNRLLYIAYHFPPLQGSTGIARTLAFAKYLREYNWDVTVLTVKASAYPDIREQNYASIPAHIEVVRTTAFDTRRHLSVFGRYPTLLAIPDRQQSWIPFGVRAALRIIRKWKPHALLSTYPVASAHCIGYLAHRLTGCPWIADFRDPMAQPNYPPEPAVHRAFERIEQLAFSRAARVLVTTPGAADLYAERFPHYPRQQIHTITNGFDPQMFEGIARPGPQAAAAPPGRPLRLLHSGLLYPEERDPTQLFAAIAQLRDEGLLDARSVNFLFRASGNESNYRRHILDLGLEGIVELLPPIPYKEALAEMTAADGLMILQASNCNQQIPAKLYEYLYAARPIVCFTDPRGDTGQLLHKLGSTQVARLDSAPDIKRVLVTFMENLRRRAAFIVPAELVTNFSRHKLTGDLADMLDDVIAAGASANINVGARSR